MATKIVIQQPKPLVLAPGSDQWSSGVCECDNLNDCCFAFWCCPCFACITARDHGECLCLPLLDSFGLFPPITMAMRVSVRRTYGIEDSICNDCVLSFCCGPCSYCQIRHIPNCLPPPLNKKTASSSQGVSRLLNLPLSPRVLESEK
ncbi:hypothetical protein Q8A67_001981 [Cirrhinus molitorella]|uniref:Cornifelin n=1 Tax=Cirrhinus molitorella TaxID=172907 RepID=A0AA88TVJ9_9TELE|nr:hypothetical protein Q8A67_001981 [Cirrhinus molitorella]